LEAQGRNYHNQQPEKFELVARSVRKDSLATIIYTSGTTGRPKGVELPHDCWVYEAEAIESLGIIRLEDVQYLWLPLAHSFGKVLEAAQLKIGFKTAVDGRVEKIVENLAAVRPTFVAAVPRIFEKVCNKIVGNAQQAGGLKLKIFKWALGVGKSDSQRRQRGQSGGGLPYTLAEKLVFKKVKAIFGGRRKAFEKSNIVIQKRQIGSKVQHGDSEGYQWALKVWRNSSICALLKGEAGQSVCKRAVSSNSSSVAMAACGLSCQTLGPKRGSITARIGVPCAACCRISAATSLAASGLPGRW
jgi:acyl-CoA synthetase (AMP-forming)/AMP-acid ligase II